MNIRGGLGIIKVQLLGFLSAKGFFWTLALGWMTGPVIYLLLWSVAVGGGEIGGFDRNAFILYYLGLIFINQLTYPTAHWSTGEAITNGSISKALLRPMPLFYADIGCDLAVKIVCMPFVVLVIAILGFIFGVDITFSLSMLPAAVLALLMGMAIRFILAHILALMAFYTQQSWALLSVNDTFIFLFSGQVAPIALFPSGLRNFVSFLPYRYMVAFPIEILMGKLTIEEMQHGFAIQIAWLALLIAVSFLVTKAGVKKYSATGG